MAERLGRYHAMRDFSATPEPRGKAAASRTRALRYYIQRHAATRLHYDFRLELEGVLKSWAVPKGPSLDPADKRLAVQTEDHPLEYGEFEGVIPEKQYGAGEVLLWDRGRWLPEDHDPQQALRKGRLHFRLDGEKLHGRWILTRTRGAEDKPQWLLIKRNDEDAAPGADITRERPESVKRAPKKAARASRAELPQFVAPMLATLVAEPPAASDAAQWIYEVKHDGYRLGARLDAAGAPRLFTRSGKDWTARLPHLAKALAGLRLKNAWLDGEIVVPGRDGRSNFQALQNAFDAGRDTDIVLFAFDAPFLSGQDLRRLPLAERKARLRSAFKDTGSIRFSADLKGSAREVLEHACKLGLEGLIGKDAGSVYAAGRSKSWIKLKCRQRQDFVIGGYTAPGGSRTGFGALLAGLYDEQGKLHFAGKVGTGFDEQLLRCLTRRLGSLKRTDPPFVDPPREKGVHWVRPSLVAEVAYAERTKDGILRQASFMGLREDLPAKNVHEEKAVPIRKTDGGSNTVLGLKISHPERVIWPELGVSKIELARYIEEVGDWLLPHVKNRPLSLVRCPDGVAGECFYQRHLAMAASPGSLQTVKRERSSKGAYIYAASLDAVVSAVQNGAVELHTWGATLPHIKRPDRITMDLDPDEALPWTALVEGTLLTKKLLDGLGLESFLKTTGGKGLHVVAPIEPQLEWDAVKAFTGAIARVLVKARPDLFTAKIAKARRPNKIFADYLRNSATASAIAAYSPRARANAGVSVPLSWDELDPKDDVRARFNVRNVPKRLASLKKDPWADYWKTRQAITVKMKKALSV
ncbi:MAG TPA: DNA ligase D [Burkholderiales bacterium]|jgi:bifunctional non-homologous end joining protein LigD